MPAGIFTGNNFIFGEVVRQKIGLKTNFNYKLASTTL